MRYLLLFLFFVAIVFSSCEGRKSKSVALKESIEKFNKEHSEQPQVVLFPNEYTEVVTDSIIANTFKVHIKNFSSPSETIEMISSEKKLTYHRVFESEIAISIPGKDVLATRISAENFKSFKDDSFWDNATLQHVWVNQELSTETDLKLDISFIDPQDKSYKLYRMSVNIDGNYHTELIEQTS